MSDFEDEPPPLIENDENLDNDQRCTEFDHFQKY